MPDPVSASVAPIATLVLPPEVRVIEFISDLHLSPDLPRTLAAFEHYLASTTAQAVFILGDLFEVWAGDDSLDQPFEGACAQALRQCSQQRRVHVMRGNRDFLLGERFFAATGCVELPDPLRLDALGQRVLLSHGDALCLADTDYQAFRAQVRAPAWQAAFMARPLAERLAIAAQMRQASLARQAAQQLESYADADAALALTWLQQADCARLVHGHTHRPADEQRDGAWQRHVLSDWDLDHAARAEVLRWSAQGWQRLPWPLA